MVFLSHGRHDLHMSSASTLVQQASTLAGRIGIAGQNIQRGHLRQRS